MTRSSTAPRAIAATLALALAVTACSRSAVERKPRAAKASAGTATTTEVPSPFFELDAKPFCFAGANADDLAHATPARVDAVLAAAQALGLNVLRVPAHLERGSLDGSVPAVEGDGTRAGVYFQYWDRDRGAPAYNDGANGLGRLDYLVSAARRRGLKLLLVLTNNFRGLGGMDQYLTWYGLRYHDEFYSDARVKQAYKAWVSHVVTRKNSLDGTSYREDPAIFGWELANAPRARSGAGMDRDPLPDAKLVTAWADEMSRLVEALDANHMVAAGGEGFFARGQAPWPYSGSEGVDQDALLALPAVDFGTFQLVPESWRLDEAFAEPWIREQLAAARRADKPVLLEAYVAEPARRSAQYAAWNSLLRREGGSGALVRDLVGVEDILREQVEAYRRDTRACALADGTRTGLGTPVVRARTAPKR